MFWLLFFFIALCTLAYRGARMRTAAWAMGGAILFYGVLGGSFTIFLLLALAWVATTVLLTVPALRQEWLSRPLLKRFQRTLERLPADTVATLDNHGCECGAPTLSGAPDWATLQATPVPTLSEIQRNWLDTVIDPACTALATDAADVAARNRLAAAAAGVAPETAEADGTEVGTHHNAPDALRAAVCARAAAAAGTAAWAPCSAQRAGWLALLHNAAPPPPWLETALTDLSAFAAADLGAQPLLRTCGWATLVAAHDENGHASGAAIELRLNPRTRASHAARRYGLLVEFTDSARVRGSACVVLDAATPGLAVRNHPDGRVALGATRLTVPLTALVGGLHAIGDGSSRLAAAITTARTVNEPALQFGLALPVALASAWQARAHLPGEPALTHHSAVRHALAATAADLYTANALSALTLATARDELGAVGSAAITSVRVASMAARISQRGRELGYQTPLEAFATARAPVVTTRTRSELGLRALGQCHLFFHAQWHAARKPVSADSLQDFDTAYWHHVGHALSGAVRALSACFGLDTRPPPHGLEPDNQRYVRRVNRAYVCLSFVADLVLLSRRAHTLDSDASLAAVGDALSRLQAAQAVIWKTGHDTDHPATAALLRHSVSETLDAVQNDLETLIRSLGTPLRGLARALTSPLGRWRLPRGLHDVEIITTWLCDGDAERYFRPLLPATLPLPATRLRRAADACRTGEALESRLPDTGSSRALWDAARIDAAQAAGRIDVAEAAHLHDWIAACAALDDDTPAPAAPPAEPPTQTP
ncbi:MAG: DUF1974 domain-containing protein [Nevskiaceae bacterium]|nr:MAG: DUF1974 domain-containing protein [Nevskiaceae bacterium]TBR71992.1 MAG: DUF1974 domain-containing protein [Nevskiaceae bacterium]